MKSGKSRCWLNGWATLTNGLHLLFDVLLISHSLLLLPPLLCLYCLLRSFSAALRSLRLLCSGALALGLGERVNM